MDIWIGEKYLQLMEQKNTFAFSNFVLLFLFPFFFLLVFKATYGSSGLGIKVEPQWQPTPLLQQHWILNSLHWARDGTHVSAAPRAAAETMPDP